MPLKFYLVLVPMQNQVLVRAVNSNNHAFAVILGQQPGIPGKAPLSVV